jgi:Heterokaryon incompatibility protein (HET)
MQKPSLENREYQNFPIPDRQAVREIWLTEAGEVQSAKYLAISYCWKASSDPKSIEEKMQYVVMDRGRPRSNKALAEILDRAIHLAAYHGIKYIWNQECIDQDDRNDKELGIQSMDLVFERASMTAGLFSTAIETQDHQQALNSLQKALKLNPYGDVVYDSKKCEELFESHAAILETMEILASDRWLTRSWILQEAASAGNRLVLLAKCNPSEAFQDEKDNLNGEACIDYVHLHAFLDIIHHTFIAPPGNSDLLTLGMKLPPGFKARMVRACNRLQFLSPQIETSRPLDQPLLNHGQHSAVSQSASILLG